MVAAKLRGLGRVGVRLPGGGVFWPKEVKVRKEPQTWRWPKIGGVKPDPPPAPPAYTFGGPAPPPPRAADVAVDVMAMLGQAALNALVAWAKEEQREQSAARLIAEAKLYEAAGRPSMRSPSATLREAAEIVRRA